MKKAMDHTPAVLAALVENHRHFLSFLTRRVGNRSDAEEILQAAFAKSVEKADSLRDGESAVAWFYRLLRNAVVDFYRHRDAGRRALERVAHWGPENETLEPEVEQAICHCIHDLLPTLPPGYAELLQRIDLDGESIAAVAAETGMTANNTRVKLHRARKALRKALMLSCGTCAEHACLDCDCRRPA